MDAILKLAAEGNQWAIYLLILFVVGKDVVPVVSRRLQGQNGTSTVWGMMKKIREDNEKFDKRLGRHRGAINDNSGRLDRAENDLNRHSNDIKENRESCVAHEVEIENLKSRVDDI